MKQSNVFFYVSNMISYIRLICLFYCAIMFFCFSYSALNLFLIYFIFEILDIVDGYFARQFSQESIFGRMLDFIVDRLGLVILVAVLLTLFPTYSIVFLMVLLLDLASHFAQLYATLYSPAQYHKHAFIKENTLLGLYYSSKNRYMMLFCVLSHDMWLGMWYLYYFFPSSFIFICGLIFLPGFLLKTYIHIVQMINVARALAALEVKTGNS